MCSEVFRQFNNGMKHAKWTIPRCRAEQATLPPVGMITEIPLQKFRQTDASKLMAVRVSLLQVLNFSETEVIRDP